MTLSPAYPGPRDTAVRRDLCVSDPDPDLLGTAFIWLPWIRIRIGNADPDSGAIGNCPKFTNKPGFLPFEKAFVHS